MVIALALLDGATFTRTRHIETFIVSRKTSFTHLNTEINLAFAFNGILIYIVIITHTVMAHTQIV